MFGVNVEDSNPFRYCAEYYDKETEFIYLRARYYSPEIQRFISEDPIKDGINWYAYCGNSPIIKIDYTGLKDELVEERDPDVWSLNYDDYGLSILIHYLYGNGEDYNFENGGWGKYMKENDILTQKVKDIVFPFGEKLKNGEEITIYINTSMEIENGEDIIGYQYLHGTNSDVGGFQIQGTISKNDNGDLIYDLTYTWNDIIDPNYDYKSDAEKAEFAKKIPFANPTDYKISISWTDKTVIKANPGLFNWNSGWLS